MNLALYACLLILAGSLGILIGSVIVGVATAVAVLTLYRPKSWPKPKPEMVYCLGQKDPIAAVGSKPPPYTPSYNKET